MDDLSGVWKRIHHQLLELYWCCDVVIGGSFNSIKWGEHDRVRGIAFWGSGVIWGKTWDQKRYKVVSMVALIIALSLLCCASISEQVLP